MVYRYGDQHTGRLAFTLPDHLGANPFLFDETRFFTQHPFVFHGQGRGFGTKRLTGFVDRQSRKIITASAIERNDSTLEVQMIQKQVIAIQ